MSRSEDIIKLAAEGYRMSEIARRVKCSRQWVSSFLKVRGIQISKERPELQNPDTFTVPDEVVASELNIPVSRVTEARKVLNIRPAYKISMERRHLTLCKYLFGNYEPGPNFASFIREQIGFMSSPRKRELIEGFYLDCTVKSLAANINSDSDRVYRSVVKKDLKDIVSKFKIDDLVNQKVLNANTTEN